MTHPRNEPAEPSKKSLITRRPVLRAIAGVGALGALGGVATTPTAAASTKPPEGDGTSETPYVITDVHELQWIGTGDGTDGRLSAHYVVGKDIDASGEDFIPIGDFDPTDGNPFTGSFNGQGNTITGLVINRRGRHVGLFGGTEEATINSVHLRDVKITGRVFVGSLVGDDILSTVSDCSSSGQVTGERAVGGLVGFTTGTVSDCSSSARVSGVDFVGGLVGVNDGTVSDCSSSARVSGESRAVGGLVGFNVGTVSDCSSRGNVTGIEFVGGLVGFNDRGTVSNCSSRGRVTGDDYVGGLVGINDGTVCGSDAKGSVSGTTNVGDLVGGGNPAEATC